MGLFDFQFDAKQNLCIVSIFREITFLRASIWIVRVFIHDVTVFRKNVFYELVAAQIQNYFKFLTEKKSEILKNKT